MNDTKSPVKRVVYLFGAGASHACAQVQSTSLGILMKDLNDEIEKAVHDYATISGTPQSISRFANGVVDESTDIEQVITFLEQSASADHQHLGLQLRRIFEKVLRNRLQRITDELRHVPSELYAALIDLYEVRDVGETLKGILTINYDLFLEHAIEELHGFAVDYGITLTPEWAEDRKKIKVLKLHGSFGWSNVHPIEASLDPQEPLLDTTWYPEGEGQLSLQSPMGSGS